MTDLTQIVVPIELKALLVNQPVINGTRFRRWTNHYEYLVNNMQSPTPEPFQDGGQDAKPGIHLHWRLPQALTHGQEGAVLFGIYQNVAAIVTSLGQDAVAPALAAAFTANGLPAFGNTVSVGPAKDGDTSNWLVIDWANGRKYLVGIKIGDQGKEYLSVADANLAFPEVPNRWLISRFQPGMTKVDPKSWIIESDVLNAGTSVASYLDPKSQNLSSAGVVCKIGKVEVLTATWTDPGADQDMFLQAIGPGDVTFAAYAPAVENVFSFVDTDAAQLPENTPLTYVIVGWYANAEFDPLNNPLPEVAAQEFLTLMKSLHWDIAGVDDIDKYTGPIAEQSVYHGMVHSLVWQTSTMPSGQATEIPQDIANTVKVAIGNTSVEALTALIGATAGDQSIDLTLLEALQYGVIDAIDQVGGRTIVADKMRQARYATKSGGLNWDVVPSQQQGGALSSAPPPDLSAYADGLATLNQQQQSLDEKMRELVALQWTLYARWWKNQNYNVLGLGPTNPPDNMDTIAAALQESSSEYQALVASIQKLQQEISALYSNGIVPLASSATAIGNFASNGLQLPGSLVLKAANAPRYWQPRDPVILVSGVTDAGNDNAFELVCRTAGQLITGLKIKGTTVTATGSAGFIPLPLANANLPPLVAALCQEAYFLDPGNAENIAKNLFKGNVQPADVTAAVAGGTWADAASSAPAPVAVTSWKQPWMPLFLEWSIKFFPTCAQADQDSPWLFSRGEWTFDGDDYDWNGTALDESIMVGYSGRTVLSSHAIVNFEGRLRDFINKSKQPRPDLEKLDALVKAMQSWGILSQSLSGLHEQFATRSIGQSWPPIGDTAALIQDQYGVSPDPTKGDKDSDFGPPPPTFFPQMGGFFVIDDIGIVDAFGQSISLMPANNNPTGGNASAFTPIRSRQVTPAKANIAVGDYTPAQFVKQAFGLVQAAKLEMRWVDAGQDDAEVGLAAGANPVCGWLLPNHLDAAISVYDQPGKLLGELRAAPDRSLTWYPAPDSDTPITDPATIPNAHLASVVTGLIAAQKAASATLDNFMQVIDETLWLVDPIAARSDANMSVLIGRPLAVLRMKVGLDLEGPAYADQSWAETFTGNDNGITGTGFALRLGSPAVREDGLIGYFSDEKYQTFNSVYYPAGLDRTSSYVQQIGGQAANYLSVVPKAASKVVTLLMDPRGSVHGSTGILPVKEISLPPRFVDPALKNMEVTFRVGSLLTAQQAILIPRLSEQNGQWSWIDHSSATDFQIEPIEFASPNAKLSTPAMMIRDGWLKFVSDLEGDK